MLLRHAPFLKAVLMYACTAFGGPQVHIAMMIRTFAQKRKDVTEEEMVDSLGNVLGKQIKETTTIRLDEYDTDSNGNSYSNYVIS